MDGQDLAFYMTLFENLEPERLQREFLRSLLRLQNVERGSLWVKEGDSYVCVQAMGPQSRKIKGLSIPRDKPSIVGWVIENGEMTIAEGGKDYRHYREIEDGFAHKSNLILCFPLILKQGGVYGAVQLIDTSAEGSRLNLDKNYLGLLQTLVSIGSVALSNSLAYSDKKQENLRLKQALRQIRGEASAIGQSEPFLEVMRLADDYARTDFPVLITGESGTGKELAAQEIHRRSARHGRPFLAQNCSAIPETLLESELFGYKKGAFTGASTDKEGLFAAADGGTVFLDEVGEMPTNLQARILRVLQNFEVKPLGGTRSRTVDVRILAATNKNLRRAVAEGEFREDLFYRLNVLPLHMPSLRERRTDIPLLLKYFIRRDSLKLGIKPKHISEEAMDRLQSYGWKGNIREMENFVKYVLTTVEGEIIVPEDLPMQFGTGAAPIEAGAAPARTGGPEPGRQVKGGDAEAELRPELSAMSWQEMEHEYVMALLEKHRWNITRAAKDAGLKRTTFDSRMRRLGIAKN